MPDDLQDGVSPKKLPSSELHLIALLVSLDDKVLPKIIDCVTNKLQIENAKIVGVLVNQ
jgi:hypothetical protein